MTGYATQDDLPEIAATRPVWLMTLADLALLLVGFFVFVQASQQLDRVALARGIREGFGVYDVKPATATAAVEEDEPMAVSIGAMNGFASGSNALPQAPAELIAWARDATRDPRVRLQISGAVDGTPGDVDPATRSGAVLAADRARAVAAALLTAGAVPADRLTITTAAKPGHRAVTVTTGFAGSGPLASGDRQ